MNDITLIKAIAVVLKRRFTNLTVEQTIEIAADIAEAVKATV